MVEIRSENGKKKKAFNYIRNTESVLNISRLALLLAESLVFNRRNKHTMHRGTSMRTSSTLILAWTRVSSLAKDK